MYKYFLVEPSYSDTYIQEPFVLENISRTVSSLQSFEVNGLSFGVGLGVLEHQLLVLEILHRTVLRRGGLPPHPVVVVIVLWLLVSFILRFAVHDLDESLPDRWQFGVLVFPQALEHNVVSDFEAIVVASLMEFVQARGPLHDPAIRIGRHQVHSVVL